MYLFHLSVRNLFFVLFTIIIAQACTSGGSKEVTLEMAQWRGDNRDGIYNESDLLNEWPEDGPELLWMYEGIGKGYAAPSILNQRIYVNGEIDSISYLFAFDLQGNVLWKALNGKEFLGEGFSATYPGTRSTPTVVGDLVYTTSGEARLACFNAGSGDEIWAVDLIKDLGGLESDFGYSESVVVDENKVYCFPGGKKNNMVALNRFTGDVIWSSQAMQDEFSYCSPLLVQLPERKVLITHSRHYLYSVDSEKGQVLSSYHIPYNEYTGEHCNSPLYSQGNIYFIGNEKEDGAIKLKISEDGTSLERAWQNSTVKNNFNGFVKVGERLFTMVKGNWLKAIDIESGEVVDSIKAATGSIIYGDDKFICYGMNGDVNLISYNDQQFEIKSTLKVKGGTDHHFAHPVVANGVLYIRHGNALMAWKIGE